MYLEISGRQTGKTTRMLQDAAKYIKAGYRVMFVTQNQQSIRRIQDWLFRNNVVHPYKGPIHFTTYNSVGDSIRGLKLHRIYFDEFDYAEWTIETRRMIFNLLCYTNIGYFVTTAKFIRTLQYMETYRKRRVEGKSFDLLVELVRLKHYKVKSYARCNFDTSVTMHLTTEQYGTEIRGCWRTHMEGKSHMFRGVELPKIPKSQKTY